MQSASHTRIDAAVRMGWSPGGDIGWYLARRGRPKVSGWDVGGCCWIERSERQANSKRPDEGPHVPLLVYYELERLW